MISDKNLAKIRNLLEEAVAIRPDVDSLRDASLAMGFSASYLQNLVIGHFDPSPERTQKIIQFLDLDEATFNYLLGRRSAPPGEELAGLEHRLRMAIQDLGNLSPDYQYMALEIIRALLTKQRVDAGKERLESQNDTG